MLHVDVGLPTLLAVDPSTPFAYPDDAYPDVILDLRHAAGTADVAEVEWWINHRFTGVPTRDLRGVVPHIYRGSWVAGCPECGTVDLVWDQLPLAPCFACPRKFKVLWPPPKVRAAAVRALAIRDAINRNWLAHEGETVERLEFENRWHLGVGAAVQNGVRVPSGLVLPGELSAKHDVRI